MNYAEFMKVVDEKLSDMSEVEKTKWIHNIARTIKEHKRTEFLNSLMEKQEDNSLVIAAAKKEIEDWCSKLEKQEIYIECSSYEVYGESYWDNDYSYNYFDNFEIGNGLIRAFQVSEDLLYQKEYEQASELYDSLCSMQFPVLNNDMEEWSELELEELVKEKLVSLDLKQIALCMMYAKYHIAKGEERAAALHRYLSWNMCNNIKVEEVFNVGPEEIKGIDSFMEEWITFLKNTDGDMAGDLLSEAYIFQGGINRLCEEAKEASARHPVLYERACEYLLNEKKESECEKLGLEAIRVLPEKLIIRGKIADLTVRAARHLKHNEIIKECYEAAFYAESTLNHFLRLFEIPNYQNIVDKAAKYVKTLPETEGFVWREYHKNKQKLSNYLLKDHEKVIRFFNGEFDYIYK
ncbi:MAG TPA: hypothetical protein VFD03_05510, partial [Clostridia bacterium]|nr:hypothetical protein [Clostridia bacterium]